MYRVYKLLDERKRQLVDFLLSEARQTRSPLPILGGEKNRERIDAEEPIEETGVYRDLWERKPIGREEEGRFLDVVDKLNYVSFQDWTDSRRRAGIREEVRQEQELDRTED